MKTNVQYAESTFKQFTEELKECLMELLGEQLPGVELKEEYIDKLQGQSYLSLMVMPPVCNIGINLNLEEIYERSLISDQSMEEIAKQTASIVLSRIDAVLELDYDILEDYNKMKEHLMLQVIAVRGNEEMLQNIPHRQIEDLAIVYRVKLSSKDGAETTLVRKGMLEEFGITEEQLHQDALESAPKIHPVMIDELSKLMFGMSDTEPKLYFAGAKEKLLGAAVIFYPGVMEACAKMIGGSFYILPSSIHEVLLVKAQEDIHAEVLDEMVADINASIVETADRLTDHAYYYDAETGEFISV